MNCFKKNKYFNICFSSLQLFKSTPYGKCSYLLKGFHEDLPVLLYHNRMDPIPFCLAYMEPTMLLGQTIFKAFFSVVELSDMNTSGY